MNDLTTTTERPPSLSTLPISARLCGLLSDQAARSWALSMIAQDPETHREARRMAGALADLAEPAGGDFVCSALQPLVLVYGLGEQAKSAAFWAVYVKALSDLPREAITDAVDDYSAQPDSVYFPKPGPLRELALRRGEKLMRMASRAREAANMEQRRVPEKTDEDRAAVKEMLAGYLGTMKAKVVPAEATRANHGRTDEHGVTAEMRALIEARAGE